MNTFALVEVVYSNFIAYVLILSRISSLFFTFSIFRREMATMRILVALSVILSAYVLLLGHVKPISQANVSLQLFIGVMVQIIIGFAAGVILNITFEIFSAVGQIISLQIGLAAASLFDPKFGMITTLSNFYIITAIILFLSMNGHLMVIEALVNSFAVLPADMLVHNFKGNVIFKYASIIINASVLISITIIATTMITNICLAIMSKFAPQFNLFSVGLNMTLIIGLLCVYLTYQTVINVGSQYLLSAINVYTSYFPSLVVKP